MSCIIDAKKKRHVATCDIDGAFLRMVMNKRTHVILDGKMVDLIITANPSRYKDYETYNKNGNKVLWLEVKKALYGCMESTMLLWENISGHLVNKLGFIVNPYDMCVANKVIEGIQFTIFGMLTTLKYHILVRL